MLILLAVIIHTILGAFEEVALARADSLANSAAAAAADAAAAAATTATTTTITSTTIDATYY